MLKRITVHSFWLPMFYLYTWSLPCIHIPNRVLHLHTLWHLLVSANFFFHKLLSPGVKFCCNHCGEEGHRRHYCPLRKASGKLQSRCRSCGESGHNRRTCGKLSSNGEEKRIKRSNLLRHCTLCGLSGHNRRTCPERPTMQVSNLLRGTLEFNEQGNLFI